MSKPLSDALWYASPTVPLFLKRGVLGALCAWANDDGTFQTPPTLERLRNHWYNGRRLHERTIQYQLRILETCRVVSAPCVTGRGHWRAYALHPAAIGRLTAEAVRDTAYVKGAFQRKQAYRARKGAFWGAFQAPKGCVPGAGSLKRSLKRKEKNDTAPHSPERTLSAEAVSQFHTRLEFLAGRRDYYTWLKALTFTTRSEGLAVTAADAYTRGFIERHLWPHVDAAAKTVWPGAHIELS